MRLTARIQIHEGGLHADMLVALIVLVLLLLIFGGGGFLSSGLTILWWILIIGLVLWVLGFFFRGSSGGRWYRW